MMRWHLSYRCDLRARPLADRHYNRQSIGAQDFMPPGRCLVLLTGEAGAVWGTSWPLAEFTKHEWAGAWVCSIFRNERPDLYLSSELILEAVAATRAKYGDPPPLGMITFVDASKVKRKRDPGRCFLKAGFRLVGETKVHRRLALQLLPGDMPAACAARPRWSAQIGLFDHVGGCDGAVCNP